MKTKIIIVLCACFCLFVNGCSRSMLQKAFDGNLSSLKSNKVITEYCQSCHNHKELNPDEHVITLSKNYKNQIYSRAKECRVCHAVETDIWKHKRHDTRYPKDVKKGRFEGFESSISKESGAFNISTHNNSVDK